MRLDPRCKPSTCSPRQGSNPGLFENLDIILGTQSTDCIEVVVWHLIHLDEVVREVTRDDGELERSLKDVEDLGLMAMDMKRWSVSGGDLQFGDRVGAARLLAEYLAVLVRRGRCPDCTLLSLRLSVQGGVDRKRRLEPRGHRQRDHMHLRFNQVADCVDSGDAGFARVVHNQ